MEKIFFAEWEKNCNFAADFKREITKRYIFVLPLGM